MLGSFDTKYDEDPSPPSQVGKKCVLLMILYAHIELIK